MGKNYITLFAFFLFASATLAQDAVTELEATISRLQNDTAKVNRLNDLVAKLQYMDPAKAAVRIGESIGLAQKLNYTLGLATAYRLRGVLYIDQTILDSGKLFYDKAFLLVKESNDRLFRRQAGLLTHNYGVIYHHKQKYDSATFHYLAAAKIFDEIGEDALSFFPFNNLSTIYTFLGDNNKALEYARACRSSAVKMNNPAKLVLAVNSEMSIRLELGQYDSVYTPLKKNLRQAHELQNYYAEAKAGNLVAQYFGESRKRYDSSIFYRKRALALMKKINNQYEVAGMLQNIGYDYKQLGNYDSALFYLKKATALAKSLELDQITHYSIGNLVDLEETRGNIKAAFGYLKDYVVINDTLQARNNRSQLNDLEAKYQAEQKAFEIERLESEKQTQADFIRQKTTLNYILAAIIVATVVIVMLAYRTYQQKQKLQQQRINELEMEKQLGATQAVLKGEEQERARLAKDLHDGLGGMLSGIKYSFNTMKQNLIMTPENQQAFERSMDMLDSSIREMRSVAHNLMPEALVKFGLDTALKDFCNDINQSGALQVQYQSIGLEGSTLEQTTAITVYRIVQELINNTLKHAAAKTAIVQISKSDGTVSITVEDDGKGFDPAQLKSSKGIGYTNMQHRVDFLGGKLDVKSVPEKGTSVLIEFNV
jgi:two-component system, NarL family, sensor kinase